MMDYYALLGVPETATESEIRTAFRTLVQSAMDDQPRFSALTEAFETLKDPEKRAAYDALRRGERTVVTPMPAAAPTVLPTASPSTGGTLARSGACPVCNTVAPADEGFCPECGLQLGSAVGAAPKVATLPKLVDAGGREFLLRVGENILGREGAEVMLPDGTVSRRHARLTVAVGNTVTLEDLGSTNGTKLGGRPLPAGQKEFLQNGAQLQFGSVRLTIQIPAVPQPQRGAIAAGSSAQTPIAALPGSVASAAMLVGSDGTRHSLKSAVTTVGRRAGNDLVLANDAFISGSHAKLTLESGRYLLTDLGSTNGTRVNGKKLDANRPESLAEGDTIQFGQTSFTFRLPK